MTTEELCNELDGISHTLYALSVVTDDKAGKHALQMLSSNLVDIVVRVRMEHG